MYSEDGSDWPKGWEKTQGMCEKKKSVFWLLMHPSNKRWFSDKVKIPLRKAILHFASKYPTPTRDNLYSQNSHILLDYLEYFEAHDNNETRTPMVSAALKILIDEYDHDIYYRRRFDDAVEFIKASDWATRDGPPGAFPYTRCWKSDDPTIQDDVQLWKDALEQRQKLIDDQLARIATIE